MNKRKKVICVMMTLFVLALSYPLSVPTKAVAIDPVTFMYPIWQMVGQAGGVTITTVGGDDITQSTFPSLFDEWQQSRVDSGLQQTAQSISEWVSDMWSYVKVAPSVVSAGILNTALRLESNVVLPLQQFWNWIIKDKLNGSSYDAIDFDTQSGNLVQSSTAVVIEVNVTGTNPNYSSMSFLDTAGDESSSNYEYNYGSATLDDTYAFVVVGPTDKRLYFCNKNSGCDFIRVSVKVNKNPPTSSSASVYHLTNYDTDSGFYYYNSLWGGNKEGPVPYYYVNEDYPNKTAMAKYVFGLLNMGELPDAGSITVGTEPGLQSLDFPDASDPEYFAPDMVIPWNVPYDQTLDTNGYLEDAYEKALDNTLTDEDITSNPPVEGTGTVGNVGEYVAPGLAEVFPFCIPFDVYNFLEALAAEPEAPSFTAQLDLPESVGGTRSITLDFDTAEWNAVAQILRTLELLLFIIGLAVVTREKFIRS